MRIKFLIFALLLIPQISLGAGHDRQFRAEVIEGLDIISLRTNPPPEPEKQTAGELGSQVYGEELTDDGDNYSMFIPTNMYVRLGAGLAVGGISAHADAPGKNLDQKNGWLANVGLGFDLSSYVRGEFDFQTREMKFAHDAQGRTHELGGTVYFDFIRRYERYGDITERRIFVPYMGLGVAGGDYDFIDGDTGAFLAPRGALGFNVALTPLWGLDLRYQYSMFISNHFGYDSGKGVRHLHDFILSVRAGF